MNRIVITIAIVLGLGISTRGQAPPLPDTPISHVTVSASFVGYDSNGRMVPANVDTIGLPIYRNSSATQGFDVSYEHIAIPDLGQRWELGLGCYWYNPPKVKNILLDTSQLILTGCAGAGKLLSATDGNRFAYTIFPSVTYPITGHMAWTVSYQYVRATGGIAGTVNKSGQSIGIGPQLHW
jgi:hypothetical protein